MLRGRDKEREGERADRGRERERKREREGGEMGSNRQPEKCIFENRKAENI